MKHLVKHVLKILKTGQVIIKVNLADWLVGAYIPYKETNAI